MRSGHCAKCGGPVGPTLAGGLCPRCLLGLGLDRGPDQQARVAATSSATVSRRIVTLLGRGLHGAVYLAEQQPSPRLVALKVFDRVIPPAKVDETVAFMDQLRAFAHPAANPVLDAGLTEDGHPYLVGEYLRGTSLDRCCRRARAPEDTVLSSLALVAEALGHAHQAGLPHGHLAWENLRTMTADPSTVRLCDVGSAALSGAPATVEADLAALAAIVRALAAPAAAATDEVLARAETASAGRLATTLRALARRGNGRASAS